MRNQRGFTLLEMMVVVAIIAILAGILIPNFTRARAQAQTAACIGNMKMIATALELYYTDKQYYPAATNLNIDATFTSGTMNGYLNQVPEDPAAGVGSYYMLTSQSASGNRGVAGYTIWCPGRTIPRRCKTSRRVRPARTYGTITWAASQRSARRARKMFDPVGGAMRAFGARAAYAPALAFAAGTFSSFGPCVAPRFIAIAGLTAGRERAAAFRLTLAFVIGLVVAYTFLGAAASIVARVLNASSVVYAAIAAAMFVTGTITLWRGDEDCKHRGVARPPSYGSAGLLGATLALLVSPCCAPMLFAVLASGSTSGSTVYGCGLLACFALGHAIPIIAVAAGMNGLRSLLDRLAHVQVMNTISATLMLALGAYYAALS